MNEKSTLANMMPSMMRFMKAVSILPSSLPRPITNMLTQKAEINLPAMKANATYFNPYETDEASQLMYAMDLSPLAANDSLDIIDYVTTHIRRFQQDVETKLKRQLGKH